MERPKSIPFVSVAGFVVSVLTIAATLFSIGFIIDFADDDLSLYAYIFMSMLSLEIVPCVPLLVASTHIITARTSTRAYYTAYEVCATAYYSASFVLWSTSYFANEYTAPFDFVYFPAFAFPVVTLTEEFTSLTEFTVPILLVAQHLIWIVFAIGVNAYVNSPPVSDWLAAAQEARKNTSE